MFGAMQLFNYIFILYYIFVCVVADPSIPSVTASSASLVGSAAAPGE